MKARFDSLGIDDDVRKRVGWRQAAELTHFGDSSQVSLLIEVKAWRLCGCARAEPDGAEEQREKVASLSHATDLRRRSNDRWLRA